MTISVVSAIYGRYDWPKQLPDDLNVEAFMFTDDNEVAHVASDFGWHAVLDEMEDVATPMLRAKYWKTHMASWLKDGDVGIWLDGSMKITEPYFADKCVAVLGNDDVAFTPHPERTCIYPEAELTASLARYADVAPRAQANFYRDVMGWPTNWGLFASGAFAQRISDTTALWGEFWWKECLNWTYQDQLSLPVITDLMGKQGMTWNKNLPWHSWWSLLPHGS